MSEARKTLETKVAELVEVINGEDALSWVDHRFLEILGEIAEIGQIVKIDAVRISRMPPVEIVAEESLVVEEAPASVLAKSKKGSKVAEVLEVAEVTEPISTPDAPAEVPIEAPTN